MKGQPPEGAKWHENRGKRPVGENDQVWLIFRNGEVSDTAVRAGAWRWQPWASGESAGDIVRWCRP